MNNYNLIMSEHKKCSNFYMKSPTRSSKRVVFTERSLDNQEDKLQEKICKLKLSLKSSAKHNEELHHKLKKSQDDQTLLKNEIRKLKRGNETLRKDHDRIFLQNQDLKLKLSYAEINERKHSQIVKHQRESEDKDKKQLSQTITRLKRHIQQKESTIEELRTQNQAVRKTFYEQKQSKIKIKNIQIEQLKKQVAKLKESIKDLMVRGERNGQVVEQKEKKNRKLELKEKETKVIAEMLEKQNISLKESKEKISNELFKNIEKTISLEKKTVQLEYEKKNLQTQLDESQHQNENLQSELLESSQQFNQLNEKHFEILSFNYELQKDIERELHTIAKELARRHIATQSPSSSTVCPTPLKKNQVKQNYFH